MFFDEGNLSAFDCVAQDGNEAELHHRCVGIEQHGLWNNDVEIVAIEGDTKVGVTRRVNNIDFVTLIRN